MIDDWWHKRLSYYREKVSDIDHEILELINKRMGICIEIGEIKKLLGNRYLTLNRKTKFLRTKQVLGQQ